MIPPDLAHRLRALAHQIDMGADNVTVATVLREMLAEVAKWAI